MKFLFQNWPFFVQNFWYLIKIQCSNTGLPVLGPARNFGQGFPRGVKHPLVYEATCTIKKKSCQSYQSNKSQFGQLAQAKREKKTIPIVCQTRSFHPISLDILFVGVLCDCGSLGSLIPPRSFNLFYIMGIPILFHLIYLSSL
jgi:hypothetical protein